MHSLAIMLWVVAMTGGTAAATRTLWLFNVHTNEELRIQPFDVDGHLRPLAWLRFNRFMRSRKTDARRTMHPRLLRTLLHVQQHFGGKRIEVVSGFRQLPEPRSYHNVGRAADVRIDRIPARTLFGLCRSLPSLGCGFYPRTTFVHIDVRNKPGMWVDTSPAGQANHYVRDPRAWLKAHPP